MVDQVLKELSSKNGVGWSWRSRMSKWLLIRGWNIGKKCWRVVGGWSKGRLWVSNMETLLKQEIDPQDLPLPAPAPAPSALL